MGRLKQVGFVEGRLQELPLLTIGVVKSRRAYETVLDDSGHAYRPASFSQPERLGPGRLPVAWMNEHVWQFSWPVVPLLFVLGLLCAASRWGLRLVAFVAVLSMASLAALLAAADRYMLLLMPLLWLVAVGGLGEAWSLVRRG